MSKCSGKYLGSPLYRGSILWNKLDKKVQDLPIIRGFSNVIMKGCKVYVNLINWPVFEMTNNVLCIYEYVLTCSIFPFPVTSEDQS